MSRQGGAAGTETEDLTVTPNLNQSWEKSIFWLCIGRIDYVLVVLTMYWSYWPWIGFIDYVLVVLTMYWSYWQWIGIIDDVLVL